MSIGYNENDIPNRNTALAASSQISADAAAIANQKAMEANIAPAKKGAKAATRKYDLSGGLISRSDQPSAVYQPTASTAASGGSGKKIVNTFTRFDGKQIKTLYDFAMANRNRIATRNDLTGGRQKSDTIRQLHTNILKNK